MDIRKITPHYAVSQQILVEHLPAIAAAGFTTVICNRPDSEIPFDQQAAQIGAAARAAGLRFEVLELTMQTMTPQNVERHKNLIDGSDGPVLAYCRSGTRCSIVWALGQAGDMSPDQILAAAQGAGYDLSGMATTLTQIAQASGKTPSR